ncbi:MAG: U32 family peptidase [Christensenellaceae bacterium]|jgi:putative protease|nr:U32 family peptidase [Christensenellaceae bacterium]
MEILTPAGDIAGLKTAVNAGADAVYLGLSRFSARARAKNFTVNEYFEGLSYARRYGCRVYIALNVIFEASEIIELCAVLDEIINCPPDAFIITDLAIFEIIAAKFPNSQIHISTQCGVSNIYAARFYKNLGADRVVLARETAFEDIKKIVGIINAEAFIHGASCVCFSGACRLCEYESSGSGNRGTCAQPCREIYEVEYDGVKKIGGYLSAKDICVAQNMEKLDEIGVTAGKIEGRLRRKEYAAEATLIYKRKWLRINTQSNISRLKRIFNRGNFTAGYAFDAAPHNKIEPLVTTHLGETVGKVTAVFEKGGYLYAKVESSYSIKKGDGFKILRSGSEVGGSAVTRAEFLGNGVYVIPVSRGVRKDDIICLTTEAERLKELAQLPSPAIAEYYEIFKAEITLAAKIGEPLEIDYIFGSGSNEPIYGSLISDYVVDKAKTQQREITNESFEISNPSPYIIDKLILDKDRTAFIPSSAFNELRKRLKANFEDLYLSKYALMHNVIARNNARNEFNLAPKVDNIAKCQLVYLPANMTGADFEWLNKATSGADRVLVANNIGAVQYSRENGVPYVVGKSLNMSETVAQKYFPDSSGVYENEEVMTLSHCPYSAFTGRECRDCAYSELKKMTFTNIRNGNRYSPRRIRLSGCRFELLPQK